MSKRLQRTLIVLGILAFLAAVKWIAHPAPSTAFVDPALPARVAVVAGALPAQVPPMPAAPAVSIVFLLDSSPNMQPRIGRDYFELARDGVTQFLSLPGFPEDGTYEISVIQYAKKDVPGYVKGKPGYHGTYHWFGPIRVVDEDELDEPACEDPEFSQGNRFGCATKEAIIALAAGIEHTEHFTGMLLESGLREADSILETQSAGDGSTDFNIILLGTGEYRLPDPCPPADFRLESGCTTCSGDCAATGDCNCPSATCDVSPYNASCNGTGVCNRACHVRCYAANAANDDTRISAIHIGPEYHHYYSHCEPGWTAELPNPYGGDYCSNLPSQPDRAGFLQELTNSHNCPSSVSVGKYERMTPDLNFGNDERPSEARDIAKIVAQWLCEWVGGVDTDGDGSLTGDGIPWICDNCPTVWNPRQRDCNLDGVGDVCQRGNSDCCYQGDTQTECDENLADDDKDGLCHGLDQCEGGDDCLVRFWAKPPECNEDSEEPCACDIKKCGCDCDDNEEMDFCQAAKRSDIQALVHHSTYTLDDPLNPHAADSFDNGPVDGIPDCATDMPAGCPPVPCECDLEQFVSCDALSGQYGYGTRLVDFRTDPAPDTAAEWLQENGWTLSGLDDSQLAIQHSDSTDWPCKVDEGSGYLAIDERTVADTTLAWWHLDSESYKFRKATCSRGMRRSGTSCVAGNCAFLGPWSYQALDIELNISNGESPSREWQLVIWDPCQNSDYERLRLRFVKESATKGDVQAMYRDGEQELWSDVGEYSHNEWFRLRIIFDNTAGYRIQGSQCTALTLPEFQAVKTVKVYLHRAQPSSFPCHIWNDAQIYETDWPKLSYDPGYVPGLQVRIEGNNQAGRALWLGALGMRPTDGCEFDDLDDQPLSWPCSGGCGCSSSGDWECQSVPCTDNAWYECEVDGTGCPPSP